MYTWLLDMFSRLKEIQFFSASVRLRAHPRLHMLLVKDGIVDQEAAFCMCS